MMMMDMEVVTMEDPELKSLIYNWSKRWRAVRGGFPKEKLDKNTENSLWPPLRAKLMVIFTVVNFI